MAPYTVAFAGSTREFDSFLPALAFLETVRDQPGSGILIGAAYDPGDDEGVGKCDGLTEAEREAVERVLYPAIEVGSFDPDFKTRLDRIANFLAYEQSLKGMDPLEVMAAQLRMGWDK